jgi:tripartite-type tricarboxylate transporter receptor subunit TctC
MPPLSDLCDLFLFILNFFVLAYGLENSLKNHQNLQETSMSNVSTYKLRLLKSLFVSLACVASISALADFPDKPIKMIVPYPPGGSTDIIARAIGQKMGEALNTQVVIETKPGASAMIGTIAVAKSPADGYTLLMTGSGPHSINISLFKEIAYDPIKDFDPLTLVAIYPLLMVVNAEHPATNVGEFIAWVKANKAKANFCSIGPGTPSHLAGELFQSMAGIEMTHIPYKGSSQAIADIVGGHCTVLFDSALSSGPQVKGGKLRAIGIGSKTRIPAWPDVATISESGLKDYEAYTWGALLAPTGVPKNILERLQQEAAKAVSSPSFAEMLYTQGGLPGQVGPDYLMSFTKSEISKWGKIIKQGNIKPE